MGTITFRIVEPSSRPFADPSILDACTDPQFNGVFPDDPDLGIVPERKANTMQLTQDYLKSVLHYDPETGEFTNLTQRGPNVKIGAKAGTLDSYGYYTIGICGSNHKAHRLAWLYMTGELPENDIDHINGAPGDNRFCNLRAVTRQENMLNKGPQINNYLQVRGVYPEGSKFRAEIRRNGTRIYLGMFNSIEEAVSARETKLTELNNEANR